MLIQFYMLGAWKSLLHPNSKEKAEQREKSTTLLGSIREEKGRYKANSDPKNGEADRHIQGVMAYWNRDTSRNCNGNQSE